jgi:hypothetical protein
VAILASDPKGLELDMGLRTCIFCLLEKEESEFNEEHVFPRAIGGSFVTRAVCAACNGKLGSSVDAALTQHVAVQMRRNELNLEGNSRTVPDPLRQGTLVQPPYLKVGEITTPGSEPLRIVPDVRRDSRPDGSEHILITMDARDEDGLIAATNKILQRKGFKPKDPEEIRSFIKRVSDPTPEVAVPVTFDLVLYKPALLKIAYELTAIWLGDAYLADPAAGEIRRTLSAAEPMKIMPTPTCLERIGRREQGADPADGAGPNHHLACVSPVKGTITALVHVFDIFEAVIVMSADASCYPTFTGRLLVIDAVSGTFEEKSL